MDRAEELPPPSLVVVVGPKGCGKSTLIRSLVKYYTGQALSDVLGPVTVVCGKKKRVTFFECPADDLCAMLDLGTWVRWCRFAACDWCGVVWGGWGASRIRVHHQ